MGRRVRIDMEIIAAGGKVFSSVMVVGKKPILKDGKHMVDCYAIVKVNGVEYAVVHTEHGVFKDNTFHVVDQVKFADKFGVKEFEIKK